MTHATKPVITAVVVAVLALLAAPLTAAVAAESPSPTPSASPTAATGDGGSVAGTVGGVIVDQACSSGAAALPPLSLLCAGKSVTDVAGEVKDAQETVAAVASFAENPGAAIVGWLQTAVEELAMQLLPALADAMQPDLTAQWWRDAYEMAYGLAIVVWVFLFLIGLIRTGRGKGSGEEFLETMLQYIPGFFLAASFGPMLAVLMAKVSNAITQSVIKWGFGGGAADMSEGVRPIDNMAAFVSGLTMGYQQVTGGHMVAIVVLFLLMVSFLSVAFVMAAQLMALYLVGALLPLGLVWWTSPKTRAKGWKIPTIWVGILFVQPLLFLMLGMVYRASADWMSQWDEGSNVDMLLSGLMIIVAMVMAAFAPLGLVKMAGAITPTATPGQSSGQPAAIGSLPGVGGGSQTARLSSSRRSSGAGRGGGGGRPSSAELGKAVGGGTAGLKRMAKTKAAAAGGPVGIGLAAAATTARVGSRMVKGAAQDAVAAADHRREQPHEH